MKRVAIIGAGAAGCFCAVQLRRMAPELAVTLFEAGAKPMAKLAITGGGRCNLTNSFQGIPAGLRPRAFRWCCSRTTAGFPAHKTPWTLSVAWIAACGAQSSASALRCDA